MKSIKSIIAVILIGLMVFANYPEVLYSNASVQNISEDSTVYSSNSHVENDEESHAVTYDNCHDEECHEVSSNCCHDKNNEQCHETLCSSDSISCRGVKIAVFDSGISDLDTAGSISFVEDKEILSTHGDTIAHILKDIVPNAKLYDVRILNNKNEGTYSNLAEGVDWAVKNDIDIISLGMVGYEASSILENALKTAEENNILVIAAAGNGYSDEATYPAAYPTVISVGALNENSEIAEYSNYGNNVDVYAYASFKGTSFAAQYIVAAAVKKMASNPTMSVKEIRSQITGGKIKNSTRKNNATDGILHAAATCSHVFNGSYTVTKQATCTATGTKVGKCTKCGAVVSTVTIAALGHSYGSWTTTKAATCTTAGSRKRTCSRCSTVDTDTIAATGHTFNGSFTTTKEPTCTATGTKVGKCSKCSAVVSTVTIDALGHSYGSWTTTVAATCAAAGSRKRTCSRSGCSSYETQAIAATGHTFNGSFTTTKEPTCTAAGTKVGKCSTCGTIVTTVAIDELGHSYGSWATTVAATCTTAGSRKRTCTRSGCSSYETQAIAATGHTFNGSFTTTKEPTCTAAGTKVGKCSTCGTIVTTVAIDELGHSYGSWTTVKAATCTDDGIQKRTCTRDGCISAETKTITAAGHTFNGSFTTTKEPTCTTTGIKVGKCSKCGETVTSVNIDALGHSYGSWTTVKAATCTDDGIQKRTCTRDGCISAETKTITAVGHTFNGSFTTTKEPTCTTTGTKVGKCSKCGETVASVNIDALGHSYGSWTTVKAATCSDNGIQKRTCTRDGCISAETKTITAAGHTFNGSFTTTQKATCTASGIKVGKCSKCGEIVTTVQIPKLEHSFEQITITPKTDYITTANTLSDTIQVKAICSSCGKIEDVTNKATFSSSNSSVATVSEGRIKSGTKEGTATITAYYEGKKAVCNVTVNIPGMNSLRSLIISPQSETITEYNKLGSKLKVTAIYDNGAVDVTSSAAFTSGNSSIAYAYQGYIKSGLKQGSTVITASFEELKATCNVTVDMYADTETKPLKIGKSTGLTIPEDLPVLGGTELNFALDFIPTSVSFGKNEFKIAVGVNDVKSVGENWSDFKKTFEEAKKSMATMKRLKDCMKAFGGKVGSFSVMKSWKPDLDVYGYVEGTVTNGVPTVTKGALVLMVEANYTSKTQYLIGPVPVYLEIGGGVKLESINEIINYIPSSGGLKLNSELKITPRFELGGGLGVVGVLTVGGTGEAELEFKIRDAENYLKITLTGSLNLKATALFFEAEKRIAEGTWTLYETKPSARMNTLGAPPTMDNTMYDEATYSMMSRDYINKPSEWTGNKQMRFSPDVAMAPEFTNKETKVLGTNIYPNAQIQLATYGDKQVLAWIADNPDRTSSNRTMLVYSVYDKASKLWSTPSAVADDGTADFYPQLAQDEDRLFIVWQNSNKKFNANVTLEEVASSGEIAVSQFDAETNTFGTAVQLTDNDMVDTLPQITVSDGKAYVAWTSNDANDIFGVKGKNSIYYSELTYEGWLSPEILCEGLNAVPSISIGFIDNTFTAAYILDEDNVLETINDRELYTVRPEGTSTRLTNNDTIDSSPVFSKFNETDALYWYNEGNISYLTQLDATPNNIFEGAKSGLKDNFKALYGSQEETAIIWTNAKDGSNGIYGTIYDKNKGQWSEEIKLSDISSEIQSLDGTFDSNGNFSIAYSKNTMLADGNKQSDLCIMKITPSYSLSVNSVNYNQNKVIPGTEIPIDVEVSNNGEIGVEEVIVDILDNDDIVNSQSVQTSLKPGETKTVTVSMNLPETIEKKTYKVMVSAVNGDEYDTSDNIKEFVIGYTDISLQIERYSEENFEHVAVHVLNLSHVPSGAVLKVTKGSEKRELIDTKVIDNVAGAVKYEYQFDKNALCADKDSETLYFTVEADKEELYTSDNSKYIVIESEKPKPIITVSAKNKDWSNTSAVVSPSVTVQEGSEIAAVSYSWSCDDTYDWKDYSSGDIIQNEEGIWFLHIKAVDSAGNEAIERFGTYNIDKTLPEISCNFRNEYAEGNMLNLEYFVRDNLSEIKNSTITLDGRVYANGDVVKLDGTGKKIIEIIAEDTAGNVAEFKKEINIIGSTIIPLYGDVDGDGNVDSDDYAYMRQWLIGMITDFPGGEIGAVNADVDGNGNINSDDYAYMRQWLTGMITNFPAEEN
jgi:hypothetical protein